MNQLSMLFGQEPDSAYDRLMSPARKAGEQGANAALSRAAPDFMERAKSFVHGYLVRRGQAPGEQITDACVAAGIRPAELRAFGGIYQALSRAEKIRTVAFCARKKGHLTAGGRVWALVV